MSAPASSITFLPGILRGKATLREMGIICASAVIQCYVCHPLHLAYARRAAENRRRVARGRT